MRLRRNKIRTQDIEQKIEGLYKTQAEEQATPAGSNSVMTKLTKATNNTGFVSLPLWPWLNSTECKNLSTFTKIVHVGVSKSIDTYIWSRNDISFSNGIWIGLCYVQAVYWERHTHTHTRMNTHAYMHAYTHAHTCTHTHTHAHTHARTHAHTHTHTRACAHTYTHKCIHSHKQHELEPVIQSFQDGGIHHSHQATASLTHSGQKDTFSQLNFWQSDSLFFLQQREIDQEWSRQERAFHSTLALQAYLFESVNAGQINISAISFSCCQIKVSMWSVHGSILAEHSGQLYETNSVLSTVWSYIEGHRLEN